MYANYEKYQKEDISLNAKVIYNKNEVGKMYFDIYHELISQSGS